MRKNAALTPPNRVTGRASGTTKTSAPASFDRVERAGQRRKAVKKGRDSQRPACSSWALPGRGQPGLPVDIVSSPRGLPALRALIPVCGRAYMRYAVAHTTYALAHTSGKKAKCFSALDCMLWSIHAPLIAMAPQGAISARQGTPERACARPQPAAWGVKKKRRRASASRFLATQTIAPSKPICNRQLARAALERPRPPRTSGNSIQTAARLPCGSAGSRR